MSAASTPEQIVAAIVLDLKHRWSLGQAWEALDEHEQAEMLLTWTAIAEALVADRDRALGDRITEICDSAHGLVRLWWAVGALVVELRAGALVRRLGPAGDVRKLVEVARRAAHRGIDGAGTGAGKA
jgi:hypothetical protein